MLRVVLTGRKNERISFMYSTGEDLLSMRYVLNFRSFDIRKRLEQV